MNIVMNQWMEWGITWTPLKTVQANGWLTMITPSDEHIFLVGWKHQPVVDTLGYSWTLMDSSWFELIRADSSSCWVALEGSYLVNITLVIVSPQGVSGITGLWPHKHSETLATKSLSHWLPRFRSYSEYLPLIVGRTTPELCWFSPWSCWR